MKFSSTRVLADNPEFLTDKWQVWATKSFAFVEFVEVETVEEAVKLNESVAWSPTRGLHLEVDSGILTLLPFP